MLQTDSEEVLHSIFCGPSIQVHPCVTGDEFWESTKPLNKKMFRSPIYGIISERGNIRTGTRVIRLREVRDILHTALDLGLLKFGFESRFVAQYGLLDRTVPCLNSACQKQVMNENKSQIQ